MKSIDKKVRSALGSHQFNKLQLTIDMMLDVCVLLEQRVTIPINSTLFRP